MQTAATSATLFALVLSRSDLLTALTLQILLEENLIGLDVDAILLAGCLRVVPGSLLPYQMASETATCS